MGGGSALKGLLMSQASNLPRRKLETPSASCMSLRGFSPEKSGARITTPSPRQLRTTETNLFFSGACHEFSGTIAYGEQTLCFLFAFHNGFISPPLVSPLLQVFDFPVHVGLL